MQATLGRKVYTNTPVSYNRLSEDEKDQMSTVQMETIVQNANAFWEAEAVARPATDLPNLIQAYLIGKEAENTLRNYGVLEMVNAIADTFIDQLDRGRLIVGESSATIAPAAPNVVELHEDKPRIDDDVWDEFDDIFYD